MKTTEKGDIGVIKIMDNLINQGVIILTPFNTNLPFDFVAYANNTFYRIQVKYRKLVNDNALVIYATKAAICNNHISRRKYDDDDFDVLAVYCPNTGVCYFIPKQIFHGRIITLRFQKPKNNQKSKIKYAADYVDFNKIVNS
jgi:hypothetical protein